MRFLILLTIMLFSIASIHCIGNSNNHILTSKKKKNDYFCESKKKKDETKRKQSSSSHFENHLLNKIQTILKRKANQIFKKKNTF